jgi:hypothetical protein
MRLSPLAETILIDGFDGGHMWGEPNRLPVETLMDLRLVSFIQTRMARGQLDGRTPSGISDSGRKPAREL